MSDFCDGDIERVKEWGERWRARWQDMQTRCSEYQERAQKAEAEIKQMKKEALAKILRETGMG